MHCIWVERHDRPMKGIRVLFGETSDLDSVQEILKLPTAMETLQVVCLVSPTASIRLPYPLPALKFAGSISVEGGDASLLFF